MTGMSGDTSTTELTTDQIAGFEPQGTDTPDSANVEPSAAMPSAADAPVEPQVQLLGADELQAMLEQWQQIQGEFVDEPQRAIHDADALVADLMQRLARTFAQQSDQLDAQLSNGND